MRIAGGFGIDFCCACGLGRPGMIGETDQWVPSDRVIWTCNYTRQKRFRKYLMRANRNQSANTIPKDTWDFLVKGMPYSGPAEVYRKLKQGKGIKRKCYDSLPFLCSHLCDTPVPSLSDHEVSMAMNHFDLIDRHVHREGGRMISYIFCLEFILKKMGRHDMIPYVSRIKCAKRRRAYDERLRQIFGEGETVLQRLRRVE